MPLLIATLRRDTMDTVLAPFKGKIKKFNRQLEKEVAELFDLEAGEVLKPGALKTRKPFITSSCPADLVLQIEAWWTPKRAGHFENIRRKVRDDISGWFNDDIDVEVFMNVVTEPEIAALPIRDLLPRTPHATRLANQLEACKVTTVKQLTYYSASDLTQVLKLTAVSANLVLEALEFHGVRLRQSWRA